jgi:CheY-like chemotaxis protein
MKNNNIKYKILCIEDEIVVRENIAEVLRIEGYDVVEAEDAAEGLKMFMSEKPDIIISDILMPKISGYDLLKKVRTLPKKFNPQVPFLFLSALNSKADIIKGTNLTADDYLVKPVDLDILIAKVQEKLSNRDIMAKNHNDDIENVYDKVSTVFLKELDGELNSLLKLISVFKDETYGPIGNSNYTATANKMRLITQRLKTIANNTMNKNILIQKMEVVEEEIYIIKVIKDLLDYVVSKTRRNIKLEPFNEEHEYRIKFNLPLLKEVLRFVLMQIVRITTSEQPIRINFFIDHEKKFVFAFHGFVSKDLKDEEMDIDIEVKNKRDKITEHGGDIDFKVDKEDAVALVSIPEYKVIN